MEYNDEVMPSAEIMSKMTNEFKRLVVAENTQVEVCEMTEYRQKIELEEILRLLNYCESFFKWIEGEDSGFNEIKQLLEQINKDKIETLSCCRKGLDYRYACDRDLNGCLKRDCCDHNKCGHDKCGDCFDPCGHVDWHQRHSEYLQHARGRRAPLPLLEKSILQKAC